MLLVAYFANAKWCKNLKNDWITAKWVLIWEYSVRAFQWIPTWQGLDGFQKYLHPSTLGKNSRSIGRVNRVCLKITTVYGVPHSSEWQPPAPTEKISKQMTRQYFWVLDPFPFGAFTCSDTYLDDTAIFWEILVLKVDYMTRLRVSLQIILKFYFICWNMFVYVWPCVNCKMVSKYRYAYIHNTLYSNTIFWIIKLGTDTLN